MAEIAKTGRHAIDLLSFISHAINHLARGLNTSNTLLAQLDRSIVAGHSQYI